MQTIIGIESATNASSVALFHLGEMYQYVNTETKTHSEHLLKNLQALCAQANITLQDVEGIAVGIGPGSFTGVRLAVGVAQALGLGLQAPIWPVSTLEALALQAISNIANPQGTYITPICDARMAAVYWGVYQFDSIDGMQNIQADCLSDPNQVLQDFDFLNNHLISIGSGVDVYAEQMQHLTLLPQFTHLPHQYPQAASVIRTAQTHIQRGVLPVEPSHVLPNYVRNQVAHQKQVQVKPTIVALKSSHIDETA